MRTEEKSDGDNKKEEAACCSGGSTETPKQLFLTSPPSLQAHIPSLSIPHPFLHSILPSSLNLRLIPISPSPFLASHPVKFRVAQWLSD